MARQFQNPYYADNSKKIIVVEILEKTRGGICS